MPIEPQKSRKGLPFLKNPMSTLLLRRRGHQNTPDVAPLPLAPPPQEPVYDPRIKGTRVHDFSAPRNRATSAHSASRTALASDAEDQSRLSVERQAGRSAGTSVRSAESGSLGKTPSAASNHTLDRQNSATGNQLAVTAEEPDTLPAETGADASSLHRSTGSTRATRSRNVSFSSIPKHMKSTSSRFSFDMIGAAKQEKIMEERHRQRAQERQGSQDSTRPDSRFDEFDEDDFDYDAMMDDDGLEERIPGVNADYDDDGHFDQYLEDEPFVQQEDVIDEAQPDPPHEQPTQEEADLEELRNFPENDQENFAGFVFQRSNPTSSLASPQIQPPLATPRDANGNVIGNAVTKDTPTTRAFPLSPEAQIFPDPTLQQRFSDMGVADAQSPQYSNFPAAHEAHGAALQTVTEDDLYYDDGIAGYEDEFAEDLAAEPEYDTAPFDESIFDLNDTDEYGRPIPGAFAKAQSKRQVTQENISMPTKRESDMTSGFSGQSGTAQSSTAHTSMSVDAVGNNHGLGRQTSASYGSRMREDPSSSSSDKAPDHMDAYQAALAAAAHKAAASGKFQRSSSPPPGSSSDQVPEDSLADEYGDPDAGIDDYESEYVDMNDFELDDDAIIAEANASVLADDSDGWYGSEFGFYAAPINQHHGAYSSSAGSEGSEFNYANGGFFGPKGMSDLGRSASGRLISREPNLTPITERSEYSNRNSMMSMSMSFPGLQSGTPTTLQSPGLAQLAMMAETGDDQMTLSALLRLRSKAWGESQASSPSTREGSPKSERGELAPSPWPPGSMPPPPLPGHVRQPSTLSSASRDSDANSSEAAGGSASPTITMAMPTTTQPLSGQQPPAQQPPRPYGSPLRGNSAPAAYRPSAAQPSFRYVGPDVPESAPVSAISQHHYGSSNDFPWVNHGQDAMVRPSRSAGTKSHHRHNSSSDSVSYMLEGEDTGNARWVMERRRTGEYGQVEVVEREVVEGGRI